MQAEAVDQPASRVVVAEGGLTGEASAVPGAGEAAGVHGQAVDQPERLVGRQPRGQVALQATLDRPQVGRLASEGGAVHRGQAGEEVAVMAAEMGEDALVVVQAEELAGHLDGDHLAVGQARGRAMAAEAAWGKLADQVIDQAVDDRDEVVEWHGGRSGSGRGYGYPSLRRRPPWPHHELAHRVI